jgi:LmbE family N-acetylglucosaminyl deacetylase
MSSQPRVLAIHAHPDDIEFQCAGTLALLKQAGCSIVVATMTPGDCGSAEHDSEAIAAIRRAEARKAAELLGAEYLCLEFRDLAIFNDDESRRRVVEAIRRTRPDIIFSPPPVDYHADHEMTSILVRDACFCVSIPNYATRQWEPAPVLEKIPHLYHVDALEGNDRSGKPQPVDFYVDITSVYPLKRQMMACHESQRNWLLKQHGIDEYLDAQEAWSRKRGAEIGVDYAEGFTQYLGHPYPHDDVLAGLLKQDGKGRKSS